MVWHDATWAPSYGDFFDNYRSVTGWCCSVGENSSAPAIGNTVSWGSSRQPVIALATSESEWYAATEGAKEALYMNDMFQAFGRKIHGKITLCCDNQATIKQPINAVDQKSSRHIGMRAHFLRHHCHSGKLALAYASTKIERGDIFTKLLGEEDHCGMRDMIGVVNCVELWDSPEFNETNDTSLS
jgi:hypothetical protein